MTKAEREALKKKQTLGQVSNEPVDDIDDEVYDDEDEDFQQPTAGTNTKGNKPKQVTVDMETLNQLIASNERLQAAVDRLDSNAVVQSPNVQVRRKQRDFDYSLRKWDGKVVLALENVGTEKRPQHVYNIYDEKSRKDVQYVNLILKDSDTPVKKIDYITFLRDAEKVSARMISKREIEEVKEYGMIPKKEMAETGYGMFETMVMVPVEVTTKTYEMTLKLPEDEGGDEVVVSSQWLNM